MGFSLSDPGTSQDMCILFADVAESTRWFAELGDADGSRVVGGCVSHMISATLTSQGRNIQTLGDGVFAAFPSAELAMQAAERMMTSVALEPASSGQRLGIRVGFHFGTVLLGSREVVGGEIDVAGGTVNTAARIAGLAKSGQILTSETTFLLLPCQWRRNARPVDTFSLKGISEDTAIWELLWQQAGDVTAAPAFRSVFRGRPARLMVYHRNKFLIVEGRRGLRIGRELDNDLVIEDRRVSRQHARIEVRRDKFVLIDTSTNGSFVTLDDKPEMLLHMEELLLSGKGRINFGHSYNGTDLSCALNFEIA